ncbi:aryl-alcohol dehydrogenase-like predicted oxidoreductase [Sphingobium subterraneum]|uniref:Aryl-alcohol dehydrogenase-like predicted oxidoreductase n=2 Tax=Sphingobium subterraneum TaxID=627688 RepID=A0A841J9Z7_9SPHN|nr:aryl-alcohol dehydrogenase-like predicted oxidoreductase [Sphingobium subterraneum]
MTFGTQRWGIGEEDARKIFARYLEVGGNFIDTADIYAGGQSEAMLGKFITESHVRDGIVLATKAGFNRQPGNPTASGNGAKNIRASLETSLRRLQTDYIDLFWLHVWDKVTPAEEVLQTMNALVQEGKIRYYGLSNVPAWYVAKMATLAAVHGMAAPIGLQLEYSLTERAIEREHCPVAAEFGLGILPWSPLAGGFLTGKYRREDPKATSEGRLSGSNPLGDSKFSDRNWPILDSLRSVAEDMGRPMAQVALAWASAQPLIASVVIGVSSIRQLEDNLASLDIRMDAEQRDALDRASAPEPAYPYPIFSETINRFVFGGVDVQGWRG